MPKRLSGPVRMSPFARLLGLSFSEDESRSNQCLMKVEEKVLNVSGNVHGGALYALADVSMGKELYDHIADDEMIATVEMKINYLVAVSSGVLTGEANLIHKGRTLAVLEADIKCEGRLIAKAMGTFRISKISKAKAD